MNTFDNIIEIEPDEDDNRVYEPADTRKMCIYCGVVWNSNNPELPSECTTECGEHPDQYGDDTYVKELNFD